LAIRGPEAEDWECDNPYTNRNPGRRLQQKRLASSIHRVPSRDWSEKGNREPQLKVRAHDSFDSQDLQLRIHQLIGRRRIDCRRSSDSESDCRWKRLTNGSSHVHTMKDGAGTGNDETL